MGWGGGGLDSKLSSWLHCVHCLKNRRKENYFPLFFFEQTFDIHKTVGLFSVIQPPTIVYCSNCFTSFHIIVFFPNLSSMVESQTKCPIDQLQKTLFR